MEQDNLVPVTIDDTGTVTKANTKKKWYSYENKEWANAVILRDESKTYEVGATIPEDNIESYFVWIPIYKYKIFNLGNYTGLTSIIDAAQTIEIKFGTINTSDSISGECTTPMDGNQAIAGSSGNCEVGEYMTHPAFISFDSNGFWVGKFETGYDGATTTSSAQVNSVDTSKIVVKPNVYSWRNINVGNAFKNSYEYQRDLDSHMMKNTEWGAVAYLSHSEYGLNSEVVLNNNSSYLTGCGASSTDEEKSSLCKNAFGTVSLYYQTTSGNISGVFDMSGGTAEFVMGYNTKSTATDGSKLTDLYSDFFINESWNKYYDEYTENSSQSKFDNRILGDATGEMGPFEFIDTQNSGSWYGDDSYFNSVK